MEADEIVKSTAEPAFATDQDRRIVSWNEAAEQFLGHAREDVLGRPCYEVTCGRDLFGNRHCDEVCPLSNMVRRGESIRHFELDLRKSSGERVRVSLNVLVIPGGGPDGFAIVHLMRPGDGAREHQIGQTQRPASSTPTARSGRSHDRGHDHRALTNRELDVLRLMVTGAGTEDIAKALSISLPTVRNHTQHIFNKLEVHSRVEAVVVALRERLI
jgi:PAS domain S-box-containing protein